jgi:MFS transporter, PAT family, beta-lactamase induction signal transducer AmpG
MLVGSLRQSKRNRSVNTLAHSSLSSPYAVTSLLPSGAGGQRQSVRSVPGSCRIFCRIAIKYGDSLLALGMDSMTGCRPILWLPMALPTGVATGFVSVALANTLARAGIAVSVTGDIVATFFLALTLGVFWGPAIDSILSRRFWVVIGVLLTSVGLFALTMLPSTLAQATVLSGIAFLTGTGAIIVGLASKGIAAYVFPMDKRSLAGAWYAFGNLGSSSIVGAVGVFLLASTLSRTLIACIVAGSVLITLVAVAWLPSEAMQPTKGAARRMGDSLADIWTMLRGPKGKVALALCVLPFGTGAAINLMPSVAPQWSAGPGVVSAATAISAPVCAIAALAGGWICVRLGAWRSFVLLGIVLAATALVAIPLPHSALSYAVTYNLLAFAQGAIFTAFYAVAFDTAEQGAASSKMGVFLSVANLPYSYIAVIEGRAVDHWGIAGLLLSDVLLAFAGLAVVGLLARWVGMSLWQGTVAVQAK